MSALDHMSHSAQAGAMAAFLDHETFCRQSLTIRDKDKGLVVPLRLTPAQLMLTEAIESQRRKSRPVRIRVLKARQVHMSVGCASHIWKACAFLPGQQAKVYAHLNEATTNLYNYYDQFDSGYKPLAGIRKLPRSKGGLLNKRIKFEGGGGIEFGSAETSKGGRSASFKFLHLSETAFWQRADELRTGLLASVPDSADTMILDESTANGIGGAFYTGWQNAMDPSSDNGWLGVFFAWWMHPEYSIPIGDIAKFQESMNREEHDLCARYNLKPEQIMWRRWAISNKCEGEPKRFQQEFPACAEEAFLASGLPFFDMGTLERHPVIPQSLCGELVEERIGPRLTTVFEPRLDGKGLLRIWKRPELGHQYIIGTDTAKGIDVGEGSKQDPDYSVAHVLDAKSGEQVAVMRGRVALDIWASNLFALWKHYNEGFLVPDADTFAVAVIQDLLRLGFPIGKMYHRKRDASDRNPAVLHQLGFLTTELSRAQVLGLLQRAIREMAIYIHDPITMQELRTFVWVNGKVQGTAGAHDDCVMSLALAVEGIKHCYLAAADEESWKNASGKEPTRYKR